MVFHKKTMVLSVLLMAVSGFLMAANADFYQNRIYKVRTKLSLNRSWKFIKSDPANAQNTGFDDAAWATVNVPHSAQYDPPTVAGELNSVPTSLTWNGVHWYRKTFTVPSTAHNQKVFLEFDGAMQIAQVYLNGTLVGTHDACGFTGFSFDVTGLVNMSGTNTLAVRLDCRYRNNIPPGRAGNYNATGTNTEYPDFLIYSGLYRDVWLVCTDNVYIPANGQKVSTPVATSSSATVRVKTSVTNANAAAKTVTAAFCIVNSGGTILATCVQTKTVAAGTTVVFDTTCASIAGPSLWTPESPVLYRVFTKVATDGADVDDYVERFGIRSISWTRAGGFYLNGVRYELKGVCLHQEFAWVENAVPHSRFFEEVRLAKEMGANAIRCSHYPRSPAFYNACDERGMICLVELPAWGCCGTATYPADFWTRMGTVAQEMVAAGYNHPSIILWGIFNEPNVNMNFATNFQTQFAALNTALKGLDSTRNTTIYGASSQIQVLTADVYGMNYELYPYTTLRTQVAGGFVSEYYEGWIKWGYRGDTSRANDGTLTGKLSENRYASDRWSGSNNWTTIHNAWNGTTQPVPGGGFMWSFVDYVSPFQNYPMGVLDLYRIPKKAFYTFRFNWMGTAQDTFIVGITPTHVHLEADLTTLNADSTDITRVLASLRDAQDRCAFAARSVTLTLTGPADCFDTLTRTTIAGKIGWVLKSRNIAGAITAIVTSSGLTPDTVVITSVVPDTSSLPFIWPPTSVAHVVMAAGADYRVQVRRINRSIIVAFASPCAAGTNISLFNVLGRTAARIDASGKSTAVIDTKNFPAGCYFLYAGDHFAGKVLLAGSPQ
jgi:beta-galactosidase